PSSISMPNDERATGAAVVAFAIILVGTLLVANGTAREAWEQIASFLSLQGKPEPASANVLSEHETEALDSMSFQNQAELLLERSINHYRGATDEIARRVDWWVGKIALDKRLDDLFATALNSDDLR